MNAVCQAEKAALDVFVIILENFVELVEESGLLLHSSHPSKVQLEQQQEGEEAFASNHYMLMLQKSQESLEKGSLFEKDAANLWIVYVMQGQIQHGYEGLLHAGLPIAVHQCLTKSVGCDGLEYDGKQLWV